VDTALWYSKMARKDYTVGAVPIESGGVDDPDQMFYEDYVCGALRNYSGYCNPQLDKLVDQQSMKADPGKRKQIVWQIERILAEAGVRPVLYYPAGAFLLGALGEGADPNDQQHIQRLAHGRRLARQIVVLGLDSSKISSVERRKDQQRSVQREAQLIWAGSRSWRQRGPGPTRARGAPRAAHNRVR
jgi:hypothetical protein